MGSHGYEHRDLGLHSYPCACLRIWSCETLSAALFRYHTCFYLHEGIVACSSERVIDPVQAIDPVHYRSHTSPRPTACPADYTQFRVRKQSNECESEKRLVKRQWLGIALTVCGARGTLTVHAGAGIARGRTTALPSREYIYHIFPTESHVHNFHSVFEHAQSVRLHGKTHWLLFRAGARTESRQRGPDFLCADRAREAFSLPSIGLLEQFF